MLATINQLKFVNLKLFFFIAKPNIISFRAKTIIACTNSRKPKIFKDS